MLFSGSRSVIKAFEEHYKAIWGDRWESLRLAISQSEKQVVRWNRWAFADQFPQENFLSGCIERISSFAGPQRTESTLLDSYVMDPASVMVARALPVKDGDIVLDLCAAPGGKTLILAEKLIQAGELAANELSPERRGRLQKVIQNYVPREVRDRIWVKGQDGSLWGMKHPSQYEAVLLDAPCSGERHLLENAEALSQWTPKRGYGLAHRQYALLCSAWMATAAGGYFLYSTCSLNEEENDGVIRKFLKKKSGFKIIEAKTEILAEKTEHGQIFLPDRCGFGPLYFCLMQKD